MEKSMVIENKRLVKKKDKKYGCEHRKMFIVLQKNAVNYFHVLFMTR